MKRIFLTALAAISIMGIGAQKLPYQNPELTFEQRADDLLKRLTLEEKVSLMMNDSKPVERLGIPAFNWWSEALHGIGRNGIATVFPITMNMAATWNDELVERVFTAVSDEGRAKNQEAKKAGKVNINQGLSFWTPNINIFRDPRWGRGQETYGEDPYLTSTMGMAVVRGLQGPETTKYRKLYACAKHFSVHSGPEWSRHTMNIDNVEPRDLYETYLPAFKALVEKANVREVMCAYQRFDGDPCCGSNKLLGKILRDDWNYKHIVVSDCGAVSDFWVKGAHEVSKDAASASAKAVLSGTDVECGGDYNNLPEAIRRGEIKERDIDVSLRRLLIGRFELGELDPDELVEWTKIPSTVIASKEHRQLALDAAHQGIVLLKNANGALPLAKTEKVMVMGPNAKDFEMMWGNYNGYPTDSISIYDGICNKLGRDVKYAKGCELVSRDGQITKSQLQEATADADVVIFVGGINPRHEGEEMPVSVPGFKGGDRTNIDLPAVQSEVLKMLAEAGKKVIYVQCSGSAIALEKEAENCNAIIQAWYGGEKGAEALADIIYGDVNPSGKLPVTFYKRSSDLPDFLDYSMKGRTYRYFEGEPQFAFGYGMSYTKFEIGKPKYVNGKVQVTVANKGRRDGDEVVQVYVKRIADVDGPIKSLKAYKRVSVKAGKKQKVEIDFPRESFEGWNETSGDMEVVAGRYQLMVGNSSNAKDLKTIVVEVK